MINVLDIVKWTVLGGFLLTCVLGISGIFMPQLVSMAPHLFGTLADILSVIGAPLAAARSLFNNFFAPWSYPIVTFAIVWITTKPFQIAGLQLIRSIIKSIF